jgi:hypothetical protein
MSASLDPQLLAEASTRLAAVRQRIETACAGAGRNPSELTLVGACKHQSVDRIAAAVCAGLGDLGENYVQAARTIHPLVEQRLRDHFAGAPAPTPRWRMIGHLQRNKAAQALEVFRAVDTVDTVRLARALSGRALAAGDVIDICLQVNLSAEQSKSGCSEDALAELLDGCASLPGVRVVGLMTLPAPGPTPESSRDTFARLRGLRDTLCHATGGKALHHLNMGMSADLEVAIAEGSTVVRVGTDLFGERETAPDTETQTEAQAKATAQAKAI